jgi:flagellar biosynthesis/type III secretory pathway chaperone
MIDATLCREHLAELLREEVELLRQLETLLQDERDVIASGDLKRLQRSTDLRQERMAALARIEAQRNSLCTLHGQGSHPQALQQLLNWCDPHHTLENLVRESRAGALRCRQFNDRNGALVRVRLNRVAERLQALRGGSQGPMTTYGPKGALAKARGARVLGSV